MKSGCRSLVGNNIWSLYLTSWVNADISGFLSSCCFCPAGLKDILHMVSSQWDQLQRQIRRQHGWMLRAVRCIQARLLYSAQSHELFAAVGEAPASQQAACPADGLKVENASDCQSAHLLIVFYSLIYIPPFPLWLIL